MRHVIVAVKSLGGLRPMRRTLAAGLAVMLTAVAGTTIASCSGSTVQAPRSEPEAGVFPLGVWDQTPEAEAKNYASIGITQFVGLYDGPKPSALAALAGAHLRVVTGGQTPSVLVDRNASAISAWLQPEEPDNAQEQADGDYGPCIAPRQIQQSYLTLKEHDPRRPVVLGLGRGVADVDYIGRGSCAGRTDMYPLYARGADILSFDVYPVNEGLPLDIVARGVDNLRRWGGGKPVWFTVETTSIVGAVAPTATQVKAETWLAIIHGATGITYFCHSFEPSFIEAGCLRDQALTKALEAQNAQIQSLANVLLDSASVSSTSISSSVRVDGMTKRHGNTIYVFSVDPEATATRATFTIPGSGSGVVHVLGEHRSLQLSGGRFTDWFPAYGTHLYEITPAVAAPN